jgi:hypothetical protein
MHNDPQFALTDKARAYLADQRPRAGNAPWVREQPREWPPRFHIVRRPAESLSPAA